MRPIRPLPREFPSIKKAMRAARFMKWGATPLAGLAMLAAVIVGAAFAWYFGVLLFLVTCGALFGFGYSAARCPHCGQVWSSSFGSLSAVSWWVAIASHAESGGDETETFVCRRCRLDIGYALKDTGS
jgi:hypothetical protein